MPDRKFKTPNGKIASEKQLQEKYGSQFNSLIENKTFTEVNEAVYKTPNGSYEAESVLKSKYGEKFTELTQNNTFVLDTPLKKKGDTTSTSTTKTPSMESVQTNGSVDSQEFEYKPKLDPKTGKEEYTKDASGKLVPSQEKVKKGFASQAETRQIVQQEKTPKQIVQQEQDAYDYSSTKNSIIANNAHNYALSKIDKGLSEERYNSEVDNYEFTDNVTSVLKNTYNFWVGQPMTKINEAIGGDKDFKISEYKPLQKEKQQAEDEIKKEIQNGTRKSKIINVNEIDERAKEIFIKKDIEEQMHSYIDESLPEGYDREGVWKELKLKEIRSNDILRSKIASAEVFKSELDDFQKFDEKLDKKNMSQDDIVEYEKRRVNAEKTIESLNHLAKNFDSYVDLAKTDEEKLELFKYNYNDFEKNSSLFYGSVLQIAGGTAKLMAKTIDYGYGKAGLSEESGQRRLVREIDDISNEVMQDAKEVSSPFYKYKATKINSFSDLGSFATQITSEQIPILATIFLGGTPGVAAVSMSSGGQKISDIEEQEKQPFSKKYSDGEKLASGWLYAGAEFIPEKLGTARILKDMERTISAASSASRKLFKESFIKETAKGLSRFGYYSQLEGATEYITAESQIAVDRDLLGIIETDYVNNEKRAESYFSGALMGGGMSIAGGAMGFIVSQSKLYSEGKDVQNVKKILSDVQNIQNEIENNPLLSEQELTSLYKEMNVLSNKSFAIISKNANRGNEFSIENKNNLLDITLRQSELIAENKSINDSNFSNEIKKKKIEGLESEFKKLEDNRNKILDGSYTILDALPNSEVNSLKTKASRELMKEAEAKGNKEAEFTDEQITKRAVENYEAKKIEEQPVVEQTTADTKEQVTEVEPAPSVSLEESESNSRIKELEDKRDAELEELKKKRLYDEKNTRPIREKYDELILEEKSKNYDLFHTSNGDLSIENISTEPRQTRQGKSGKYGGFYTYDNIKNIISFIKGNNTKSVYGIKLNEDVEITDYDGNIERLSKEKLDELRSKGIKVIRGKSIVGKTEIIVIDKSAIKSIEQINNESTQTEDIVADGNVQPRVEPMGEVAESGPTTTETLAEESVSSTNESKPSEGVNEVKPKQVTTKEVVVPGFANKKSTYDVDMDSDGNVTEIRSKKDGRIIPKYRISKKDGKTIGINANWAKIEAEAMGLDTFNQEKVKRKEALKGFEPSNEYEAALDALAKGDKVVSSSLKGEAGNNDSSWAMDDTAVNHKGNPQTVENLSEQIWENNPDLDQTLIRDALIDIIGSNQTIEQVEDKVVEINYTKKQKENSQQMAAFMNGLTDQEISVIEAQMTEDAFLEDLTFDQKTEYYEQQDRERRQAENELEGSGQTNGKPKSDANVSNGKTEAKQTVKERIAERISTKNAKIDDVANTIKGMDSLFGFKIKADNIDGVDKQGIDFIAVIADIVKQAVAAGIHIDEAIKKTVEHFQKTYDLDSDTINQVKEKLNPKKEEVKNDNKSSFEHNASIVPESDIVGEYLSAGTTEKHTGEEVEADRIIRKLKLVDALRHGIETIELAKIQFGDDFVAKILEFVENANIPQHAKALVYVSLSNELDRQRKEFPEDRSRIQKQIKLVDKKRMAFARQNALAINMSRLQAFAKLGYETSEITDKMFSSAEKTSRRKIEKIVEASMEEINQEEVNQDDDFDDDFVIPEPKSSRSKDDVKKDLKDALKAFKSDMAKLSKGGFGLNASIPFARQIEIATPHIFKISKLLAELGGYTTKEIIEAIHDNISDKFPGIKKKDISDVLRNKFDAEKKSKEPKSKKASQVLKDLLIEAGYSRTANVTVNKRDAEGNNVLDEKGNVIKVKENRTYLDWKKLAGEEGSVDNMKDKAAKVMKNKGYSDARIESENATLKEEFDSLRASIIEKGIREINNRNKVKPSVNIKATARKLAELYNYGIFEENVANYNLLLNSALGFSDFQQKTYEELEGYARALAVLHATDSMFIDGQKMNDTSLKTTTAIINHNIKQVISKASFISGTLGFKVINILSDYTNLSQLSKLMSTLQSVENPFSGFTERMFQQVGEKLFKTTDTGALRADRKQLAKFVYKDIVRNGGLHYGDVSTTLVNKSKVEDWLNKQSDNQLYHTVMSALTARAYLNGADSYNKALITEKMFAQNMIKMLTSDSNPNGKMTQEEAVAYVSESLTGQNKKDALKTAEEIIKKVNEAAGKQVIPQTEAAYFRFAQDLVKESLVVGGKVTTENITDAYNAGYKSAGFSLGHEANNFASKTIGSANARIDVQLEKAVKEKKWDSAIAITLESILFKNILNPFVGGGSNWVVLTASKAGVNPVSMYLDWVGKKDNPLDMTTEQGVKNVQNALMRDTNFKKTAARNLIGAGLSISLAATMIASGADDDLDDWLKKNKWAKRYFGRLSPPIVVAIIAYKNNELGKYLMGSINMKTDQMDEFMKTLKTLQNDNLSTAGQLGKVSGLAFDTPLPWRFVRDVQNLNRAIKGLPEIKSDFEKSSYWNGYYQGGFVDYIGFRPEVNYELVQKIQVAKEEAKDHADKVGSIADKYDEGKLTFDEMKEAIEGVMKEDTDRAEKTIKILKNKIPQNEMKKIKDPFYKKFKRESNPEVKALLFYDKFGDIRNLSPEMMKEMTTNMEIMKYNPNDEFIKEYNKVLNQSEKPNKE